MDILFSCYRAAFSPNDQYFIEQALNAGDMPDDTTPCSPVHAMALYAKEVSGSPGRLTVPEWQLQSFDEHAPCSADLVIARAGDADPAVFFNVIGQREDDDIHRIAFDTAANTRIAATSQTVESYVDSPYRELISDQQNTARPCDYVADPASRYFDISVVFFRHDVFVPTAQVEHLIDGFVPVEWPGEAWFTPLKHLGVDFFSSVSSTAPEAICSAVRVNDQYPETLSVVSIL